MAAYKFDTLTAETMAWTTAGGKNIEITVALVQESTDFFGNGDWKPVRDGLSVTTTVKVDGATQPIAWLQEVKGHAEFTHRIGNVGLTAERSAAVKTAESAAKTHPAWVAKKAAESAGIAASREYEAHVKAVDNMMRPGGSY